MSYDIQLKVMLSPEQYLAVKQLADFEGDSQSGCVRRLIVKAVREHALILADQQKLAMAEQGHD